MSDTRCIIASRHPTDVESETGYLCYRCFAWLRRSLTELPAIATWLEVNIAAGGSGFAERVSGSSEDPMPLRADVLDLIGPDSRTPVPVDPERLPAFLLIENGRLIGTYTTWHEAQQARTSEMRLAGVEEPVIDVVTGKHTRRELRELAVDPAKVEAAALRWQIRPTNPGGFDQRGTEAFVAELRYWCERVSEEGDYPWTGWHDRNDLTSLTGWLAKHLTWIAHQDWVGEFAERISETSRNARRVAPWQAEIVRDRTPCETCGREAIVIRMAEGRTVCEKIFGGCGRVIVWDHNANPQQARDKTKPAARHELNTGEAAILARVSPATIRTWQRRGKLPIVGRDSNNRPLYDAAAVVAAAQDTARHDIAG